MIKRFGIIALIVLMLSVFTEVKGQTYDKGVGLRGGVTNGLTYKHFIGEADALDLILGIQHNGFQINGLYERHSPAFDVERLFWYYGAGGHIGFYGEDFDPPYADNDYDPARPVLGIDGILGLEYHIGEIPFTIGADIKPFLEFTEPDFYFWDIGLTVRYTF